MKGKILIVFVSMLLLSSTLGTRLVITVSEKSGGTLDLYTSNNRFCGQTTDYVGRGINEPCDALSPDVNVTFYAEVSWDGEPVNHVLVAFEVVWFAYPDGTPLPEPQCVVYRTAETNETGIAQIWFRLPRTKPPEQIFGKWYTNASAKVQEVKLEDRMYFDVGYLITLLDVQTLGHDGQPKETFYAPCDTIGIVITAKSISWMDKNVTFIVLVYDDCDVPIGQVISETKIQGGYYCSPNHFEIIWYDAIKVPQWAYVGLGKVYVSAFTALPTECGVPYCREASTTIILEWCLIGDVDGDGDVDVSDQRKLQLAMFSMPGDPNWNPNADIDGDVDVDVGDQRKQQRHMCEG